MRAASYFFGPRHSLVTPSVPLVLRQPLEAVVLLTRDLPSPAPAACALLLRVQKAGLALHRAVRLDRSARDAIGVSPKSDDDAPRLAFLLSRDGHPLAFASAAVLSGEPEADEALAASLLPCPPDVASAVAAKSGPAPCALESMYKYTSFTSKNDLLK